MRRLERSLGRTVLAAALLAMPAIAPADEALRQAALQRFGIVAASTDAQRNAPEAQLGRALFWDTRISVDGKTACASCHPAQDWGSDRRRFPVDARGKPTGRHSQTVFNAMGQPTLRWTGDRPDGSAQAEGSMTGSLGFANKDDAVAALATHGYAPRFRALYPGDAEPLTLRNLGRALAAYQASLATPAPFDRFLAGDGAALTVPQQAGLRTFMEIGCGGCHNGPLLGGGMLQRFGLTRDYWTLTGSTVIDTGRFSATKKEEDRYVFRVPMLRNIAKTAPYFHDGSVERLDAAVRVMAELQLGRRLDDAQAAAIVGFLESLTGEVPSHYAPP
jgi:cytochrome c peroxidase